MTSRTAAELKAHIQMLEDKGLDLNEVICWGWDDGHVIFDSKDYKRNIAGIEIESFAPPKTSYEDIP